MRLLQTSFDTYGDTLEAIEHTWRTSGMPGNDLVALIFKEEPGIVSVRLATRDHVRGVMHDAPDMLEVLDMQDPSDDLRLIIFGRRSGDTKLLSVAKRHSLIEAG